NWIMLENQPEFQKGSDFVEDSLELCLHIPFKIHRIYLPCLLTRIEGRRRTSRGGLRQVLVIVPVIDCITGRTAATRRVSARIFGRLFVIGDLRQETPRVGIKPRCRVRIRWLSDCNGEN